MTLVSLFAGFAVNLLVALIIVRFIYYPANQNKNYVFTYLAFNTVIYFVMSFLTSAELSLGVGFGLFAIFSVLRYRTSTMSTREMTYLFVVIALPVMNSLVMRESEWAVLLAVNAVVVAVLFVLEREWGFHYESSQSIRYDRIDLIKLEQRALLLEDLRLRTGLPIKRVEVGRLNFLNDTAELRIFYDEPRSERWRRHDDTALADELYQVVDNA
ncbi:MAG: DUF4956 domain-containing protein [Anaerolineae bacterium]|jgi:hypothetical protein|nr:DUF4956 domain-containing protein [Anaerolineae bacterium]